ncbi:YfhO family protein [Levilactobacillus cerevisiae]|uniref:YfhO family protein n=1 Tax=Levilactobacillus cerevisiae TaxID=1704076 RepID=UPI00345E4AD1
MATLASKKVWQNIGIAWLVALAIVTGVFVFWGVAPFGNHGLLMSDMGTQYIPLLTAMQHALKYQVFHLYSFSQSLGSVVVPTVAYYLLSPFNLIVVFFSGSQVPIAASLIVMAKIATIAATMTWYLQRHFRTTQRLTIIFALAFSFCGFVAVNYFDFMWLDSLIILPLVAGGLDRLVRDQRPGMFFGWLLASIVTNYYLGYMTCLFAVLYFAYILYNWLSERPETTHVADWYGRLSQFVLTSVLSGLSAAVILIPTGLGMLQTAKSTTNNLNLHFLPEFGLEFFAQFGVGATNYSQRLWHAPTVFVSSAVVLLVLTYFVQPRISKRQKWSAGLLLGALFLAMWIRTFNTIWHMMQAPAGFPFRNVFFLSFVMVVLAFAAWQAEPRKIKRHWQWGLPTIQVFSMVIGAKFITFMVKLMQGRSARLEKYYQNIQLVHWHSIGLSAVYIVATAVVIFATQRLWRKWLISLLVITEVGGNFILSMSTTSFGDQKAYEAAYQAESKQMSQVNDPDGQLYRVQNDNTLINRAYYSHYNNYNDSLLFNFHGLTSYSSTLNEQTRQTLQKLGLYSDNVRRIGAVGLTPLAELLLGVKDSVHLTGTQSVTTPASSYSGMGFAVSPDLDNVQLGSNALRNQEAIMQALRPQKRAYFAQAKLLQDSVKKVNRINGVKTTYAYHHVMTLRATTTGPVYLWAVNGGTKYSTMVVNGTKIKPAMNANGQATLIKLGDFKQGQTITCHFAATYAVALYKTQVMGLRESDFTNLLRSMRQQKLTIHTADSHFQTKLTGSVRGSSQKSELFLSIPYDTGWHATVNGQKVATKRLVNGLMGIPIQNGQNQIQLTYHVPGSHLGLGISLDSLATFGGLTWYWRKKHGRQEEKQPQTSDKVS